MTALPILEAADPCRDCGACCRHMTRPPFIGLDDPDWERLRAERPDLVAKIEADRLNHHTDRDYPCLWLDRATGRCLHYDYRPEICRDFEPGTEECGEARGRWGIGKSPWPKST